MRAEGINRERRESGPGLLVVVLACLFLLSITIPLAWHWRQRQTIASELSDSWHEPTVDRPAAVAAVPRLPDPESSLGSTSELRESPHTPIAATSSAASELDDLPVAIEPVIAEPASPYAQLMAADGDFVLTSIEKAASPQPPTASAANNSRYLSDHPLDPPPAPPEVGAWPVPESLARRLDILDTDPETQSWSRDVRQQIDKLVACEFLQDQEAAQALVELAAAIPRAEQLASVIRSDETRTQLNSVTYDVQRRVDIWQAAHDLATGLPRKKQLVIAPVAEVARWGDSPGPATAMVNLSGLLAQLEQYEHTRLPSDGRMIADAIQVLQSSAQADHRAMGNRLDQHYRNANFRVAVSGALINRLVPCPQKDCSPVNDRIMGMPVWGNSMTLTRIHVRLVPDPHHIRLGVEAWGRVNAQTTTNSGPVYIHSDGRSDFVVRKQLLLDDEGLKAKRTIADADSSSNLVEIESNYDRVPILRGIVRNIAEREHDELHDEALRVTDAKVAAAARSRFDEQVVPRIQKASSSFYQEVWEPLVKLGLEPTTIEQFTTDERIVARLRVGDELQLTAQTARPRAPSDSWASLQIHETVLNNGLQQLALDGKTMTLEELYRYIADRLDRPVSQIPDTMPSNVHISFAPRDAVRIRCDDGQVTLSLALTEVRKGKTRWRNLVVRGIYEPSVAGLSAGLVRTGPILLVGHRLRTRDQIALRGVFSKVLSKSQQLKLVPDDLSHDKRLADLAVTQAKISDGWIGVALGPQRAEVAARPEPARQ